MFCTNCGSKNKDEARFCVNCGSPIKKEYDNSSNNKLDETIKIQPIKIDAIKKEQYENEDVSDGNKVYKVTAIVLAFIIILCGSGYAGYKIMYPNEAPKVTTNTTNKNTNNKTEETKKDSETKQEESKKTVEELMKDSNGYILPESSTEFLTSDDLKDYSKKDLAYIRNEIYAKHGYVFKSDEYNDYFSSKTWYKEDQSFKGNESGLNKYEKENIKLIKSLEEK